ncbi:hypothetical protein ACFWWM_30725 [Streptomyces sp. NPDC058682]
MSSTQRHTESLDVHLIAFPEGAAGLEVLMSRRAGDVRTLARLRTAQRL